MDTVTLLHLAEGFIFAVINFGICYFIWNAKRSTDGELIIDETNPEKDIYTLELGDLDSIPKKKKIVLKVTKKKDSQQ